MVKAMERAGEPTRRRMLKLVNRTLGVPVVRLLFAWTFGDVASRIPPACSPGPSFARSLALSLFPPLFPPLAGRFVYYEGSPPPQTPWLRQWRARIVFVVYRFLRLPSTRRRAHPTVPHPHLPPRAEPDASTLMPRLRLAATLVPRCTPRLPMFPM